MAQLLLTLVLLGAQADAELLRADLGPALCIGDVGEYRRSPFNTDAIERAIVLGSWSIPEAGDEIVLPDGTLRTWEVVAPNEDGGYVHGALANGYLLATFEAPEEQIVLVEARGCNMVYVNGVPRVGDRYGYGSVRMPVALRRGANQFLLRSERGPRARIRLWNPERPLSIANEDRILPDLVVGDRQAAHGAVLVRNASEDWARDLRIVARYGSTLTSSGSVSSIPPLGTRLLPFRVLATDLGLDDTERTVHVELVRAGETLDAAELTLRVRRPTEKHVRTFVSEIDGSVQFYAVAPAVPVRSGSAVGLPLVLSLHGAGVDARGGQIGQTSQKSWAHVVIPTNRRKFGFDWEDWGRVDALEALAEASRILGSDPQRTYVTGHSMGGHGAWHLGVHYPDLFAAVGPSAGWASFWSYGGGAEYAADPVGELLARASAPSDTAALLDNLRDRAVYVLHGVDDDNVPVDQAQTMIEHLAPWHQDLHVQLEPDARHSWDHDSQQPGNDYIDYAPMYDLFSRRRLPAAAEVRRVRFTTLNPQITASCHWVTIAAQDESLRPSVADLRCHAGARRFVGTTMNVRRLKLDLAHLEPGTLSLELDGSELGEIAWPASGDVLWLERNSDGWAPRRPPSPALKGPHRAGPFKQAFGNRMVLVYGTQGTDEEDAWGLARARYDAEVFWYRGAGSIEVLADSGFDPLRFANRNVILYGNAATNGAWQQLLAACPVQILRDRVVVAGRVVEGEDLACVFAYPRADSDTALVGVVGGTGAIGCRLTERLPYFVSGAAYPDWTVIGPEMLSDGAAGIRAAGFFGHDWSVEAGQSAWR